MDRRSPLASVPINRHELHQTIVEGPPYTRAMTLQEVIEAGKALGVGERLEAARQLLLSVDEHDDDQAGVDAEWDEVVDRRVHEILAGTAKLVDGRAAHARLRAELAERHD